MKRIISIFLLIVSLSTLTIAANYDMPLSVSFMNLVTGPGPDPDSIIATLIYDNTEIDTAWLSEFTNGLGLWTREYGTDTAGLWTIHYRIHVGNDTDIACEIIKVGDTTAFSAGTGATLTQIAGLVYDSNLARYVTRTDYQSTLGDGAIPTRIYVYDTSNSVAVEGVHIRVTTSGGTPKHDALSGSDGWANMTLSTGERYIYGTHSNYIFSTPACTLTVPADSLRDTIYAAAYDPGSPSSPDLCRVYGYIYELGGGAMENATVTFILETEGPVEYDSKIFWPIAISDETDTAGIFQVDVMPTVFTDLVSGDSVFYNVEIKMGHKFPIVYKRVRVPDSTAVYLDDLDHE